MIPSPVEPFEVMVISRGRGRGHAMPDMAIAAKLTELAPNLGLQFVSYGTGAETYRAFGCDVIDLRLPDNPPFLDMVIALTRLFAKAKPRLVVAHEEIPALPAAEALEISCIFITDFFADPSTFHMRALQYAAEVIFTAQRGLYTEPPYLQGRIHYVGRAVRQFEYALADRDRARHELGIPPDAIVVLCLPGSWLESQVPFENLLSAMWNLLPYSPKRLIWIAGRDYQSLSARFSEETDISILKQDVKIGRLMAASNVLITKATRMSVYEAAALGLPSISISNSLNWPDDVAMANVDSNTPVRCGSITPEALSQLIVNKVGSKPTADAEISKGVEGAAARIAFHVDRIRGYAPPVAMGPTPTAGACDVQLNDRR